MKGIKLFFLTIDYKSGLIFLGVLLCVSHYAKAQDIKENLKLGVIGATNVNSLISSNDSRMSVRATYMIGFLAEYEYKEKLHFQSGLLYSRQGENNRGRRDSDRFRDLLKLDYIGLPLMVKYNVFDRMWAETGLQPSYLLIAEVDQVQQSESFVQSVKRNYKDWDVLYNIGVSYKSDWGFFIGLRYSIGLTNILENPIGDLNSQRHSIYQFNFGYTF